ncbi:helix-turn-helix transcriptional regulator [Microbacterium karelineae]|uniref:helix-turn-helix transcriptional regulator n=1 Tax=Microbacterium karelineae TaxID=2654283 RepID=UPI0012E998DF|nr:helix-turn-helix domain-containing protein [Microbacterium karelineae]
MSAQLAAVAPLNNAASQDTPAHEALAGFEDMPMVMSPKTLAEILDVTPTTLERWRASKPRRGPVPRRLPGSNLIRYMRADVLAWLDECAEASA